MNMMMQSKSLVRKKVKLFRREASEIGARKLSLNRESVLSDRHCFFIHSTYVSSTDRSLECGRVIILEKSSWRDEVVDLHTSNF